MLQEYEFALREVQVLQLLQHKNVVMLLEVGKVAACVQFVSVTFVTCSSLTCSFAFTQAYQSTSGRLYLVFEYVDHTLLTLLKACSPGKGLPDLHIKALIWQLLQALSYMHSKKVCVYVCVDLIAKTSL